MPESSWEELKNMYAKYGGRIKLTTNQNTFNKLWITNVTGVSTLADCKNIDYPDACWSEGQFYILAKMALQQNRRLWGRKGSRNGPNTQYFDVLHDDNDAEVCNWYDDTVYSCIFGYTNCCVFNVSLFHRKHKYVNKSVVSKNGKISTEFHLCETHALFH